jgi:hypothetical protein
MCYITPPQTLLCLVARVILCSINLCHSKNNEQLEQQAWLKFQGSNDHSTSVQTTSSQMTTLYTDICSFIAKAKSHKCQPLATFPSVHDETFPQNLRATVFPPFILIVIMSRSGVPLNEHPSCCRDRVAAAAWIY